MSKIPASSAHGFYSFFFVELGSNTVINCLQGYLRPKQIVFVSKMGAYLSEPVTAKASEDGTGNGLNYGVSGMQGWRISMEVMQKAIFKLKLTGKHFIFVMRIFS